MDTSKVFVTYQSSDPIPPNKMEILKRFNWAPNVRHGRAEEYTKWCASKEQAVEEVQLCLDARIATDRIRCDDDPWDGRSPHVFLFSSGPDADYVDRMDGRDYMLSIVPSEDECKEMDFWLTDEDYNMTDFWEAWGPRLNDKLKRLIKAARIVHKMQP